MNYETWIKETINYLENAWGLNSDLSKKTAWLLLYLSYYGISYSITSGYRDTSKQKKLQKLWDQGQREGLKVRPATNSLHSTTTFFGGPNSKAVDIWTSDPNFAGKVAKYLGLKWGGDFRTSDPVHFYV